jgi:tetratricopeptide (TPR) repeat protein
MRVSLILLCLFLAVAAQATRPESGKDKLRRLAKLPAVTFQSEWAFDSEHGFTFGANDAEAAAKIKALRKELQEKTDDADGYLKLGTLYEQARDIGNAHGAWSKAVDIYRQRLEAQPDDAALLAKLGSALDKSGRKEEAESVLRRAVRLQLKESQGWLALGTLLERQARDDVYGDTSWRPGGRGRGVLPMAAVDLVSDHVTMAQKRLEEAGRCFDEAVTDAPKESEPLVRRAFYRGLRNRLLNSIRQASGEQKSTVEVLGDSFPAEALADLQEACRLSPKDYRLIGETALFEAYGASARTGGRGVDGSFDWNRLPDVSQRSIRGEMTHLEDLAQDPDGSTGAGALEILGVLQGSLLHDIDGRVASLRRAVKLDPSRDGAWEMLASTLAHAGRYEELLSLCEDHLKQRDTARSRILLAKAYEKMKQWDDAEEQIVEALNQSPNDPTASLALAALLLRRSDDPDVLDEANGWLSRCDQVLAGQPSQQRNRQFVIDLTLTRSIYLALTDDVDSARQWVQTVIDTDHENELAREILAAMTY